MKKQFIVLQDRSTTDTPTVLAACEVLGPFPSVSAAKRALKSVSAAKLVLNSDCDRAEELSNTNYIFELVGAFRLVPKISVSINVEQV